MARLCRKQMTVWLSNWSSIAIVPQKRTPPKSPIAGTEKRESDPGLIPGRIQGVNDCLEAISLQAALCTIICIL